MLQFVYLSRWFVHELHLNASWSPCLRQTPGNSARLWSWFDIVATRVFTTSCDGPTVQNNWFKVQDSSSNESASQYLTAVLFCIFLFLISAEIIGCPAAAVFSWLSGYITSPAGVIWLSFSSIWKSKSTQFSSRISLIECEEMFLSIPFLMLETLSSFLLLDWLNIKCWALTLIWFTSLSALSSPSFPPLLFCRSSSEKSFAWRSAGTISHF